MTQLRELYGPLKMQRHRTEANRTLLPNEAARMFKFPHRTTERWRLVHHIGDIREDSLRLERNKKTRYSEDEILAVRRLIENGDQAVELIVANAGLFEQPQAGAFESYVEHHEHLRMSWIAAKNQKPGDKDKPFPGGIAGSDIDERTKDPQARDNDLDCAILLDETIIRERLANLRAAKGDPIAEWLIRPKILLSLFVVFVLLTLGLAWYSSVETDNKQADEGAHVIG